MHEQRRVLATSAGMRSRPERQHANKVQQYLDELIAIGKAVKLGPK